MNPHAAAPLTAMEDPLFESGPPRRLTALVRLPSPIAPNTGLRSLLTLMLGWTPLAVLVAIDALMGRPVLQSFNQDLAVHARYLIAAPLLVLGHVVCARRLGQIARQFTFSGVLDESGAREFEALLEGARRRVNSLWAEGVTMAAAYLLVLAVIVFQREALQQAAWQISPDGYGLSPAGWWHAAVSVPLLGVLLIGWLWRLINWTWLLHRISRLDLHLIAAHPDRAGGLGFLTQSVRAFAIVGAALGSIAAGRFAAVHMRGEANQFTDGLLIGGTALLVTVLAVGPLMAFSMPLAQTWRRGSMSYGVLATRLGVQFEKAWIRPDPLDKDRPMLSEPDFSAATDLFQVVSNVYSMRFLPIEPRSMVILLACSLVPFLPAMFLSMPAQVVIQELKGLLL